MFAQYKLNRAFIGHGEVICLQHSASLQTSRSCGLLLRQHDISLAVFQQLVESMSYQVAAL